jgi:hypothetical protein
MEEFNCHLKLKETRISAGETSTGQDAAGTCAITGTKNCVKTVTLVLITVHTTSMK